tara:strand:- start:474 stop:653 length:180 start_codon:yes stop_codon:yes gene_type:complete
MRALYPDEKNENRTLKVHGRCVSSGNTAEFSMNNATLTLGQNDLEWLRDQLNRIIRGEG